MNPIIGWALAVLVVAIGWHKYGWQGAAFAATLVVFWLLLQFNRALRVMKNAASAPVGQVDSAVMFNAKLKPALTMMQVVAMTKSLGKKISDTPETWVWRDNTDSSVTLIFDKGRLASWTLDRPAAP
jgi:hypothetical protein